LPIQYNPRWKAYQVPVNSAEGNKPVQIYRASPNLMAINAKGSIIFKYEISPAEKLLKTISITALLLSGLASLYFITKKFLKP
jgi:hypothetical protein